MWREGDFDVGGSGSGMAIGATSGLPRKSAAARGRRGSRGNGSVAFGASSGKSASAGGVAGGLPVSKETQKLLDSMMKERGLNRRQQQQLFGNVQAGGTLPSNPQEIQHNGNTPDYRPPPGSSLGGSEFAGFRSRHGGNRYTDARGRDKDLDSFTDWRTVQLPPQRKTKTAILSDLNCGPSGRPQPEPYRPSPQTGPTRDQQKDRLVMQMAYDGIAPDGGSTIAPAARPQQAALPAAPEPDSMDEFLGVMAEIEERQAFIIQMKKMGALNQESETKVKAEIAERVAKMKTLDKKLKA